MLILSEIIRCAIKPHVWHKLWIGSSGKQYFEWYEVIIYSTDGLLVFIKYSEIDSEARIDASEVSG